MQFVLTGFTQEMGFRVFAFEGIGADRTRTKCTVKAELALIRTYGIRIQELPLLCRGLLDRREEGGESQSLTFNALTFTEDEMRVCANERALARDSAVKKRKAPPKPAPENPGAAWRAAQTS